MTEELVLLGVAIISSITAAAFIFRDRLRLAQDVIGVSMTLMWIGLIQFYLNIGNTLSEYWDGLRFLNYWGFSGEGGSRSFQWSWGPGIGWWLVLAVAIVQTLAFVLVTVEGLRARR